MQEQVRASQNYVERTADKIVGGLPAFLGALVILIISYMVAKALQAAVHKFLTSINIDKRLHTGHGGIAIRRAIRSPAVFISRLVYWVVFLFGLSIAISVLGIPVLVDFVRAIYGYLPNVLAALLIFLVASALSAGIATIVRNLLGDTPLAKTVAAAGPVIIMGIATFMILNQLRIAPQIVTITYAGIVGSAALASALAFGLGGRDVAAKILGAAYEQGLRHKGDVARQASKGAQNLKGKADDASSSSPHK
jgi:hypothetical protein